MIIDDARVSRLVCHVAEQLDMSCLAINKTEDIKKTLDKTRPDVILLDPEPLDTRGKEVFHKLAEQHANAAIVLTNTKLDKSEPLQLGDSLGLNMVGYLPDVFDADTLRQEIISIFQKLDHPRTDKPAVNTDSGLTM